MSIDSCVKYERSFCAPIPHLPSREALPVAMNLAVADGHASSHTSK